MKTIEVNLYQFSELSEEQKKKCLDKYRYFNTESNDWYVFIIDNWKEKLTNRGFLRPEIYFSGFSSQGDGASFDAIIDLSKFAESTNEKRIVKLIENGIIENFTIDKTSFANHYSHEKTRYVDYLEEPKHRNINKELHLFCGKIERIRLNLCKEIYKELENEYDHLTSDEAITESFEANDYYFDSNLKIHS